MESDLQPGSTFVHDGVTYTVVAVRGANVVATNPDGASCLIPVKDVKKGA